MILPLISCGKSKFWAHSAGNRHFFQHELPLMIQKFSKMNFWAFVANLWKFVFKAIFHYNSLHSIAAQWKAFTFAPCKAREKTTFNVYALAETEVNGITNE